MKTVKTRTYTVKTKKNRLNTAKKIIIKTLIYSFLSLMGLVMIFPFYWMIRGAFMQSALDVMDVTLFFPNKFDFGNFKTAFSVFPFGRYLLNTLILVVINVTGVLLSSSLVAFGFSRISFRGRNLFFGMVMTTMMIPGTVLQIPQFVGWVKAGVYGTIIPLTLPAWFGSTVFVFLLRQFFLTIPKEYDEAAKIEGAGYFRIFWQIVLPMSKPALLTVGIFAFMGVWNDYFGPLIYLPDERNWTLALGLSNFMGQYSSDWHLLMATSSVLVIPMILIYFFAQRSIIEGIALTGLKG